MIKKVLYMSPDCEFEETLQEYVICTSPEAGGSEDVGYEDWTIS